MTAITLGAVHFAVRRSVMELFLMHCHARKPNEAVGVFVGRDGDAPVRYVSLTNAHLRPQHAFGVDGIEWVSMLEHLEQTGERLLAICHSHPTGPPQLSERDIAAGIFPELHWVLASGPHFGVDDVTCWRIRNGQAAQEGLAIVDG